MAFLSLVRKSVKSIIPGRAKGISESSGVGGGESQEDSGDSQALQLVRSGRHKYLAGDYVTAERCFRAAVLEDPSCVSAMTCLGQSLNRLGRTREAMEVWKRAYAMEPNSEAGQKALRRLQRAEAELGAGLSSLEEQVS